MGNKEFIKKLERIMQLLNTRYGQFTDSDPDGQTLTVEDDVEVYDKINLILANSEVSDTVKKRLEIIQEKIREAYLLTDDLMKDFIIYN